MRRLVLALASALAALPACGSSQPAPPSPPPSAAAARAPDVAAPVPAPTHDAPLAAAALAAEQCLHREREVSPCAAELDTLDGRATALPVDRVVDTFLHLLAADDAHAAAAPRVLRPLLAAKRFDLAGGVPAGVAMAFLAPTALSPGSVACSDRRVADGTLTRFEQWARDGVGAEARAPRALAPLLVCGPAESPRIERVLRLARSFPQDDVREQLAVDLARVHPTSRAVQDHYVAMIREGKDTTEHRLALAAVAEMHAGDDAAVCSAIVEAVRRAPTGPVPACAEPDFLPGARCAGYLEAFFQAASSGGEVHVPYPAMMRALTDLCASAKADATTRKLATQLAPQFETSVAPSDRTAGRALRCACAPPAKRTGCR